VLKDAYTLALKTNQDLSSRTIAKSELSTRSTVICKHKAYAKFWRNMATIYNVNSQTGWGIN